MTKEKKEKKKAGRPRVYGKDNIKESAIITYRKSIKTVIIDKEVIAEVKEKKDKTETMKSFIEKAIKFYIENEIEKTT